MVDNHNNRKTTTCDTHLDAFQTTNVFPGNVGHFDDRLAQRRRIGLTERVSEMILIDRHTVENFGINLFVLDINQIHLFPNALHGRFGTERGNIGSDKAVRFAGNSLGVHVFVQLHVARVNAKDFETTIFVRDTDINFAIEASETTQGRVNGVGAVGGANDDDGRALLQPVHEGQHLTDNATFDFTVGLFTLGRNGINLVNEDNGRGIFFGFFKGLAQVGFRLAGHFGHDLGPVDQKEKGAGFVGHGTGNERLTGSRGAVQEHTTRRFDTQGLEQGGVTKGQFNHFTNLGHLLAATADIVVAHVVEFFFVFPLDGVSFAMNDRVRRDNAVGRGVCLYDLEFDRVHGLADEKQVALADGAVGFQKVWLEVNVKQISTDTFNGII